MPSTISQINVRGDGQIAVQRADTDADGVTTYHRHVVYPGADVSGEDVAVRAAAATAHTDAVIAAYRAALTTTP